MVEGTGNRSVRRFYDNEIEVKCSLQPIQWTAEHLVELISVHITHIIIHHTRHRYTHKYPDTKQNSLSLSPAHTHKHTHTHTHTHTGLVPPVRLVKFLTTFLDYHCLNCVSVSPGNYSATV